MARNNSDASQHLLPSAGYSDQAPAPQQSVSLPGKPHSDSVDREVLLQLEILVSLQQQALRKRPIGAEAIYNGVLQLLAFCLAVAFGAFTITSWQAADKANDFATKANDLASTANGLASTANTLARDAVRQGDRADKVAEQANCMAAGALVLSMIDLCDNKVNQSNQSWPFATGCQSLGKYTDTTRTSSTANIGRQMVDDQILDGRQIDKMRWFDNMVSKTWQQVTVCYDRPQSTSTSTSPTSSSTATGGPVDASAGAPNGGAIVVIVSCSLLGLGLVVGLVYLRYRVYREQLARAERVFADKEARSSMT